MLSYVGLMSTDVIRTMSLFFTEFYGIFTVCNSSSHWVLVPIWMCPCTAALVSRTRSWTFDQRLYKLIVVPTM